MVKTLRRRRERRQRHEQVAARLEAPPSELREAIVDHARLRSQRLVREASQGARRGH